jgi:potassium voltage-gated channel Eag-related subfamily H protein 8
MREEHLGELDRGEDVKDVLNAPFTMAEVKMAIGKALLTSPGKDEVCYIMLAHCSNEALDKLLVLYNRVWEEWKLPGSWQEAVVLPIWNLRKDPMRPTSYRPIALTSHVCKIMGCMIMGLVNQA